jgi:hypothetical protein
LSYRGKKKTAQKAVRTRIWNKHGWRSGSQRVMDSAIRQKQAKRAIALKAVAHRKK